MFEINWQEIKTNFPKGFENFLFYLNQENKICYRKGDSLKSPYIREKLKTICYCDIEKFFDEQGIIIEFFSLGYLKKNKKTKWNVEINDENVFCGKEFQTRDEAKTEAVPKAFEILEKQLGEK